MPEPCLEGQGHHYLCTQTTLNVDCARCLQTAVSETSIEVRNTSFCFAVPDDATMKHYTGEEQSVNQLLPAWQQRATAFLAACSPALPLAYCSLDTGKALQERADK